MQILSWSESRILGRNGIPTLGDEVRLEKVWGSSTEDVYAVGYLTVGGNPSAGILLHYDGNPSNEWVSISLDPSVLMLNGLSVQDLVT